MCSLRLEEIGRLKRKHGDSIEEIIEKAAADRIRARRT